MSQANLKHHAVSIKGASTAQCRRMIKSGFTLIELLVVIAIIAILAAILFPVFSRARENARRTSCLSNMKQLGLGMMQYTQDFDERYPLNVAGSTSTIQRQNSWRTQIFPYIKNTQAYVCPSNPDAEKMSNDNDPPTAFSISYQCARRGSIGRGPSTPPEVCHVAAILNPTQLISILEVRDSGPGTAAYDGDLNYDNAPHKDSLYVGHLQTSNYLFADGHAKALKPRATIDTNTRVMWDRRPSEAIKTPNTNLLNLIKSAEDLAM